MAAIGDGEMPVHEGPGDGGAVMPLRRWWRHNIVGIVDHEHVVAKIVEESGFSARYAFMTMMSAGIAVLGLLLSSPAVVIGAMLISPLMSPILGLGFSLALFDFAEMKRSLLALAGGSLVAIAFTALIVLVSPLKAPTAEILARTRPNLFDLLVGLFAALAGSFAIIRGRGDTIVGVAIATALMPPLAVVGYGIATMNVPVLTGSLALFITNLLTIALAATVMARFYGFGHYLSGTQTWLQTSVLLLVFAAMAVPLGLSLGRIAKEALIATNVRSFINESFGQNARVTQLDIDYDEAPIVVRGVVIAPRARARDSKTLETAMEASIGQPVTLHLDQVLLDPSAEPIEVQRAELRKATETADARTAEVTAITQSVALAAGIPADRVTLDRTNRRVTAVAAPLPGATGETYRVLEARAAAAATGWDVSIVPPLGALPMIAFADNVDTLDPAARAAVLLSAWEARRWNIAALGVPGLPGGDAPPADPTLDQRRGIAVAALLRAQGLTAVPAPADGQRFRLTVPSPTPDTAPTP